MGCPGPPAGTLELSQEAGWVVGVVALVHGEWELQLVRAQEAVLRAQGQQGQGHLLIQGY